MLEKEGRLPDAVIACVGGGSNAIGSFYHFIQNKEVRLIGCEAAGRGIGTLETAATINTGRPGIFHGMKSYFCQDEYGQIAPVYSISAGLDYPGIDRSMPIYMIQEELSTYRSQMTKQSMRLNIFRGSRESYRLSKALTQSLMHARSCRRWTRIRSL